MATAAESRIRLLVDALERRDGMGLLGMTAMPEEVEAVNESRRESLFDEFALTWHYPTYSIQYTQWAMASPSLRELKSRQSMVSKVNVSPDAVPRGQRETGSRSRI